MNFYEYYTTPEELDGYDDMDNLVPLNIIFNAINKKQKLSKKQEKIISHNPLMSQQYAIHVLKGPFPLGEPAIKRDKWLWDNYLDFIGK